MPKVKLLKCKAANKLFYSAAYLFICDDMQKDETQVVRFQFIKDSDIFVQRAHVIP